MSTEMNTEELGAFYNNLSDLVAGGKEGEAREYLSHHLSRFPEDLKNEILGRMFLEAIVDEAREIETIAGIQKEGISAIKALEVLKKEIAERKQEPKSA